MKVENSTKHIKAVAIIGMIVTAIVAVVAIVLSIKKDDDDDDFLDLLDDDFFDEDPVDLTEDHEDEGMILGSEEEDLEDDEDTRKGFCGLRSIHCKCVQCDEKSKNCGHCENCNGVTDAVGEHEDCQAEGYMDEKTDAE